MGDLDASPLFDDRHVLCVRRVIEGRPLNPLSGIEQAFIRWTPAIKEINEKLYEFGLIERLVAYKHYVAPEVAVRFLVEAKSHGVVEDAKLVLEATVAEKRGGDLKDLIRILKESQTGIPAEWAVTVFGENVSDRHAKPEPFSSGLNLDAMSKFR